MACYAKGPFNKYVRMSYTMHADMRPMQNYCTLVYVLDGTPLSYSQAEPGRKFTQPTG